MISTMMFLVMGTHAPAMQDVNTKSCRVVKQEFMRKEISPEKIPPHCQFMINVEDKEKLVKTRK